MRTLLIGLGGTGGNVLRELYSQLSYEEKQDAHCIYMDLDSGDVNKIRTLGIESITISSADTVEDVANALGEDDGVYDWLPSGSHERVFLSSGTDDGASQNRYKSRLCMARFLRNPNNELHQLLCELTPPGIAITAQTLRVMIVSSIAGGTGAGTFIPVALYVRKFFRDLGQPSIRITGLFACPDLFVSTLRNERGQETKRVSMFANAYAAIRELNAMNLAVSGSQGISSDYGKSIQMAINTHSEGKLFDSKDPEFAGDYSAKPFDLLYFIDQSNKDGGILRGTAQYYRVMADVARTRLFSKLEASVESDESNELIHHSKFPTAIYGSAGYGRIVYPYEDILRYLAERKTCEELDYKWRIFEREWQRYCTEEQMAAVATGHHWAPTAAEREQHYMDTMHTQLAKPGSSFQSLKGMIGQDPGRNDRASAFLMELDLALASASGVDAGGAVDGRFGLGRVQKVATVRERLNGYVDNGEESGEETYLERLDSAASSIDLDLEVYINELLTAVTRQSMFVSSAVLPMDELSSQNAAENKERSNLYYGLLQQDGKDIHPLAARYLLYRVRQLMQKFVDGREKSSCEAALKQYRADLDLTFDPRPEDGEDITVSDAVEELGKRKLFNFNKEGKAKGALDQYMGEFRRIMGDMMTEATQELKRQAYKQIIKNLDILIAQYEGFFENLDQYRTDLQQKMENDESLHDHVDDRCIFVAASPEMKRFYYRGEPSVRGALESGSGEIYAAAGKGIYEALLSRAWKKAEEERTAILMQGELNYLGSGEKDTYDDMGNIFSDIVASYTKYLREKAPYLQTSAMGALINQCCQEQGVDRTKIATDARFEHAFREQISDLIAKASPMVRYSSKNKDKYFAGEEDVSEVYAYLGMNPDCLSKLAEIFPAADGKNSLNLFQTRIGLARLPVLDSEFSPYEIFCFSAVHCLQPTQIHKFSEDRDTSYYQSYKQRIQEVQENYILSMSPHIDKRWHTRGAIPYISRKLEIQWREEVMKAAIYEMLVRDIGFTSDSEGRHCFISKRDGNYEFIQWPKGKPVLIQNLSRVIEHLANQEDRVPELAKKLDKMIDYQISLLTGYIGSLPTYKAGMTRNDMLRFLRTDLLSFFRIFSEHTAAHGKHAGRAKVNPEAEAEMEAVRAARSFVANEEADAEAVTDQQKTLGGLLEVAWLIHKSEENLGEDRDYGEALLRCGAYILDRFCQNMFGNDWLVRENTPEYQDYVNLYNSAMEKMVEDYVVSIIRKRKLSVEQLQNASAVVGLMPQEQGAYPNLNIPDAIRNTREFAWITANWRLKSVSRNDED